MRSRGRQSKTEPLHPVEPSAVQRTRFIADNGVKGSDRRGSSRLCGCLKAAAPFIPLPALLPALDCALPSIVARKHALIATSLSGFAPLQVPRPELLQQYNRLTNRVLMKGSDDGCEMVTLEAHASAVFRNTTAAEAGSARRQVHEAKKQFECLQVGRFMLASSYVSSLTFPSCHCLLPASCLASSYMSSSTFSHLVTACCLDIRSCTRPCCWACNIDSR